MTARRPRPRNAGLKWIVLALAAVTVLYFGRTLFQRSRKAPYPATAFFEVKRGDLLISIVEDGALRAVNETVIRSGLEGFNRIIHLVPEGARVEKGELLVEFDSSGLKDRLNEQELSHQDRLFQLSQAKANLSIQKSLAESQIKDGELKIENAESDLEKYRDGEAPLLMRTVEVRSGVIAEQVRIAKDRYARTQELLKSGNATKSEVEADALSLKREQLALAQYQEDLRLIKKYDQPNQVRLLESKVVQAKAELDRLKQRTSNEIAQVEADLKTSQRSLDLLEESIDTQKQRLENVKILAPQDGLVVYASVSPFSGGGDYRRDESRFRGSRGSRGSSGRRSSRSSSENNSSGASSSASPSATAQAVSSANQRIASAVSGSEATQTSSGGSSSGGGGNNSSAGGRGGSSGGGAQSASAGFVSYPSMRPNSTIAANRTASAASTLGSSGSGSSGGQGSSQSISPQFGFRSDSLSRGYEFSSPSGVLQEGTMVRERQELIRLPDVSKMVAEIAVHESRVRQVRPGMPAYIRIDSIPDRHFKGTVRRVALLPDAQMSWMNPNLKVFPAEVLIDDQLPDLKPGVSARAEIIITNVTKVLSVPIQTVARLEGENVCFIKKGRGVAPVPVTTGWFNDRYVEITSGLKEGDLVLLAAVGDESIDPAENEETNAVEAAAEASPPAAPPAGETPREGRRMQRRNADSPEGGAQRESRRNRDTPGQARNTKENPE